MYNDWHCKAYLIVKSTSSSQSAMSRRLTKRHLTEPDDYRCPLPAETQRIAEDQLRETAHTRAQALASLRSWLDQNPKMIAMRMGETLLLRVKLHALQVDVI